MGNKRDALQKKIFSSELLFNVVQFVIIVSPSCYKLSLLYWASIEYLAQNFMEEVIIIVLVHGHNLSLCAKHNACFNSIYFYLITFISLINPWVPHYYYPHFRCLERFNVWFRTTQMSNFICILLFYIWIPHFFATGAILVDNFLGWFKVKRSKICQQL